MMFVEWWLLLLGAIVCFLFGVFCSDLEKDRFYEKLDENLRVLEEIKKEQEKGDMNE